MVFTELRQLPLPDNCFNVPFSERDATMEPSGGEPMEPGGVR